MKKIYNFCAGPAMLPEAVMQEAQAEFLNWHGTGMSAMELGHREKEFKAIAEKSESDLRQLLNIPDNYHVLFLAGGASHQFSMVPLNLFFAESSAESVKNADYVNTGIWSQKAIDEGKRYGQINQVTSISKESLRQIPAQTQWNSNPQATYLHYTPNETIDGIEFHWVPETGSVPLVADMSSTFLSRPIDVNRFGIIYAGAQKNIGPAGLTLVIIRDDLVKNVAPHIPILYQYNAHVKNKSMYNTPPTYSWYIAGLVFAWLRREGGLTAMAEKNKRKSQKFYQYLDSQDFYHNSVHPSCRSWMNIPFGLIDESRNEAFLQEARQEGLVNLMGHRSVGGMRASFYNAMPEAGIDALIDFMKSFVKCCV